MSDEIQTLIARLLRGISTSHVETVRDAWRDLLVAGPRAVPDVADKLESAVWQEPPRGPSGKYFGILLALLSELDPGAFARLIDRMRRQKLHPLHRKTLDLLAARTGDSPAFEIGEGIAVYIAPDIAEPAIVVGNLRRWERAPGLDLGGVSRIDVIARHAGLDYLGLYSMFFSGIILTWPAEPPRGLRLWAQRLDAEFTFYHEVGHHVSGHIEAGSVAAQEDEADAYARRMFRAAHPVLSAAGRGLLWPLGPLLRRIGPSRFGDEEPGATHPR
ncbi:MAG: hypothetical protein KJN93_08715 [Alphaproteobacteria bacterium]|nr:hypothetical protein [Alphaproteobacteria bacterium]NNF24503.1 hypothetical protein [Paracoccaceae bacterium]